MTPTQLAITGEVVKTLTLSTLTRAEIAEVLDAARARVEEIPVYKVMARH